MQRKHKHRLPLSLQNHPLDILRQQLHRLHNRNRGHRRSVHDSRRLHVQSHTRYIGLVHIFHHPPRHRAVSRFHPRRPRSRPLRRDAHHHHLLLLRRLCNGLLPQSRSLLHGHVDRTHYQPHPKQCGALSHLLHTGKSASVYCLACLVCWVWGVDCLCEKEVYYICHM